MTLGAFASATGMGLLATAVALHSLPIFLLATAMAGAGYSLLYAQIPELVERSKRRVNSRPSKACSSILRRRTPWASSSRRRSSPRRGGDRVRRPALVLT